MQEQKIARLIIKDNASEFDLQQLYNCLTMMSVNAPAFKNYKPALVDKPSQVLALQLSDIEYVKKTLKFLNLETISEEKTKTHKLLTMKDKLKFQNKIYIRPTQDINSQEKTFWLVKDSFKEKLKLECPKFAIILPDQYLLTIQRKCICLYEINGTEIDLKDYDSVGINKKMTVVEVKHTRFNNRDYVIIFGNDKEGSKMFFRALTYEVFESRLTYIKRSTIWQSEVSSPAILFDNYPKNQDQKFCLIVGGYTDNRQNYNYHALQVNLYILVEQNITLTPFNVIKVDFNSKYTILSGKALQFNDYWYIFSSQTQNVSQVKLRYQQGGLLNQLQIKAQDLGFGQKIFFCENNLHLGFKGNQHMIVMINRNLQYRYKPLEQILKKFKYY